MTEVKLRIGGTMEDDAAGFVDAWTRTASGQPVAAERILAFESWDSLSSVLTGERFRLLRHVHDTPEPSIAALAAALGRQYSRVHIDVKALEGAGLLTRQDGMWRATADRITADIRL